MAFDPSKFKTDEPRCFPVILLLDLSGSMNAVEGGDIVHTGKIVYSDGQHWEIVEGGTTRRDALYQSVKDMVDSFAAQATREKTIKVAVITFSGAGASLHTPYTDAAELRARGVPEFYADGDTPLGAALKKAKELLEDRIVTPGVWYVPNVVLVSDGEPNDCWKGPLSDFTEKGRSSKCLRIAVPIGTEADVAMMESFTKDKAMIFYAQDAGAIAEQFKQVVMSVTQSQTAAKTIKAATESATATLVRTAGSTVKRVAHHDDEDEE